MIDNGNVTVTGAVAPSTNVADALAVLGPIPTVVLADCLKQMGIWHFSAPCSIVSGRATGFIGPARTMRFLPTRNYTAIGGEDVTHMGAIEASSRGEVLLIDGNGGTRAFWGSNATRMAQLQGVAGVIIDGYSRDSVLSSEIDVPVMARGLCPSSFHGEYDLVGINQPINCFGAVVFSGDIIAADVDGFVVIPDGAVDAVVARASRVLSDEEFIANAISSGIPAEAMIRQLDARRSS